MDQESRWKVDIHLVTHSDSNLVAIGEAVLDDLYLIKPVKIVKKPNLENEKEEWIFVLPNVCRTKDGQTVWEGAIEFVSYGARKKFENAMLEGLREDYIRTVEPEFDGCKLKVDVKPLDYKSSLKGLASIEYEDTIRINNIKIVDGKNGLFVSHPKTEEIPNKEKKEMQSTLQSIKGKLTKLCDNGGVSDSSKQEVKELLGYIENQETKLNQTKYKDIIKPRSYFFRTFLEDAVIKEYKNCQQQQEIAKEKIKKPISR